MAAAIAMGGTITGEHGVGRAKKAALPNQLGPEVMALTRAVKNALDPHGHSQPRGDVLAAAPEIQRSIGLGLISRRVDHELVER